MRFLFVLLFGILFSSCQMELKNYYCKVLPGEGVEYQLQLDSSDYTFIYKRKAGLLNDTLRGEYSTNRNDLFLHLKSGEVYNKGTSSVPGMMEIEVIDAETKEPVSLANIKVNKTINISTNEEGQAAYKASDNISSIIVSHLFYESFVTTLDHAANWRIELIGKRQVLANPIKWKIKKGKIEKGRFFLEPCN